MTSNQWIYDDANPQQSGRMDVEVERAVVSYIIVIVWCEIVNERL